MIYRFEIMTNHQDDLRKEIDYFNKENGSDLKIIRVLDDEVTFIEVECSLVDEKLFEFGIQFGYSDQRKVLEGRIN